MCYWVYRLDYSYSPDLLDVCGNRASRVAYHMGRRCAHHRSYTRRLRFGMNSQEHNHVILRFQPREYSVKEIVRVNILDGRIFLESILQKNPCQFANNERTNFEMLSFHIYETTSMILALCDVESIVVFIYDIQ